MTVVSVVNVQAIVVPVVALLTASGSLAVGPLARRLIRPVG